MSSSPWIVLLRGVNVGGRRKVAMADLRGVLESLGYEGARTFLQSGNAVFRTTGQGPALERQIEAGIKQGLDLDVKVLVRSAKEMGAAIDANPFVARGTALKEMHCVFLSATPPARAFAALDPEAFAPDQFEVGKGVIYVRLPHGVIESRLPDWGRVLSLTVTQRTWNTVTRLHDLATRDA